MSTVHDPDPAGPVARVVAGRYRLKEVIGRGGRAIVYSADDPLLQREVAVKVFTAPAGEAADLRLQQAEARLIAGMNHYALTTLFDAGVDTADPEHPQIYLVMERIPGPDLRRRLQTHGPLSSAQLAYLGFDLAEGLQYVHEHGFLHRDIKPANVLLADRRIETRIRGKLADFGISSIIGMPDRAEYTTGTAAYLSPEQVEGFDAIPASDVYALGLVLLEALTGRVAYPGSVRESAFARLDRDPDIPADVPAPLAEVLRSMTTLEPRNRPDLAAVALAFQGAYIGDLVAARRITPELLPPDEERRLAALRRYDVLDTAPEDAFDDITAMAARVLRTPSAVVALVDADRVWYKSRQHWDLPESPRSESLCITAGGGATWSIADTTADERTRDLAVVTAGPRVRSVAASPLRTSDGFEIGSLCVLGDRPRTFDGDDLKNLDTLAGVIMRELELRRASRRALFSR